MFNAKIQLVKAFSIAKRSQIVASTTLEQLLVIVQKSIEQERRTKELEDIAKLQAAKLESHAERIEGVESELGRFTSPHGYYYTIAGYASLHKIEMPLAQAIAMGKKASYMCRTIDMPMGEARDPRFGKVKTYPESVLKTLNW